MISFREFLHNKIEYISSHLVKNCVLLDYNGNKLKDINLSFQNLTDQYFTFCEQEQAKMQQTQKDNANSDSNNNNNLHANIQQMHSLKINQDDLNIKLNDKDLQVFWDAIKPSYQLGLNLQGQNISDESLLKLASLYETGVCRFNKLKFAGNSKITQVGVLKLGQALRDNEDIQMICLHNLNIGRNGINRIIELISVSKIQYLDLGLITNQSLKHLATNLDNIHSLNCIGFGQNTTQRWQQDGKSMFQKIIRRGQYSKRILSLNIYPLQAINHYSFISELNIITKKNRDLKVEQRIDQFKATSLDPSHRSYYDADNHSLNAYKFSVKSYLTNVFGSLLDEAMYFLEKERRNQLRDQATFDITKQPINKVILEDICTSDGSIIVLTKYLLAKIKEKEEGQKTSNNQVINQ